MNCKRVVIALVAVAALAATSVAFAGPCCGFGGARGGGWGPGGGAALGADLSKDQQKQAADLRLEFIKKTQPIRAEIEKKRIEMMELNAADKPDEAAIQKKREEIWALRDTMRDERRAMGTKFRALLTPEQRQKLGPMGGGGCGFGGGCPFGGGQGGRGYGPGRGMGRGGV